MNKDNRFCALCGADHPAQHTKHNGWHKNRRGEWFCCKSHRDQSNRQLREFIAYQGIFTDARHG